MRIAIRCILLAAFALPNSAMAENQRSFQTKEHRLEATYYSAAGQSRHASVVLLHGYRCIEACARDFERYASALTKQDIDVYVLKYYTDADRQALEKGVLDGEGYSARFKAWTSAVRETVDSIRAQSRSDGQVALVGFSQGGRLAIASAADNPAISALVVFYARLPNSSELDAELKTLPPLLLLHGDADTLVPLEDGNAIFAKAKALGTASDMVTYPGAGHGFDFNADSAAAIDARRRVASFLGATLISHERARYFMTE